MGILSALEEIMRGAEGGAEIANAARKATLGRLVASTERPFSVDYPNGGNGEFLSQMALRFPRRKPIEEPLLITMDGDPINPFGNPDHIVVGRQSFNGADVPLDEYRALMDMAGNLTTDGIRPLEPHLQRRGYGGVHSRRHPNHPAGVGNEIRIPEWMIKRNGPRRDRDEAFNTLTHEAMHAVDAHAYTDEVGNPVWGNKNNVSTVDFFPSVARKELRQAYHMLRPEYGNWHAGFSHDIPDQGVITIPEPPLGTEAHRRWFSADYEGLKGPGEVGYPPHAYNPELFAEGARGYARWPNSFKRLFPNAAREIRRAVNTSPAARWIQFNALPLSAGGGIGAALAALQHDREASS